MKKSRFSEEKIIAILKELEAGVKAPELARRHGVSDIGNLLVDRGVRPCAHVATQCVCNE
jgi:hypothetical protein